MSGKVTIIDYGMGNLQSVINAFMAVGAKVTVTDCPQDLYNADRIVLPGVGAFGDGMKNLRDRGWIEVLKNEVLVKKKQFLGICLGMQLLATTGTEHGRHTGFGWIPGTVEKFPDCRLPVPHIGWNDVYFTNKNSLFAGLGDAQVFYFVHSYVLRPEDPSVISGKCTYGIDFAASIESDNIFATQFHPEKSHKAGLAVLKNFLNIKRMAIC